MGELKRREQTWWIRHYRNGRDADGGEQDSERHREIQYRERWRSSRCRQASRRRDSGWFFAVRWPSGRRRRFAKPL